MGSDLGMFICSSSACIFYLIFTDFIVYSPVALLNVQIMHGHFKYKIYAFKSINVKCQTPHCAQAWHP
jgi:hypothetical protein